MFMWSLTLMPTSFSTMAGGGVHGKGAGIAHGTITQVGSTIEVSHHFIGMYRRVGGMTTELIVGEDSNGTTSVYLTNSFNGTGEPGKGAGIGRRSNRGVSRI
jgi:hypothetical protein